jgi:Leucine-rich repeat (LRR) protein
MRHVKLLLIPVLMLCPVVLMLSECDSSGTSSGTGGESLMTAEKPGIDTGLVLDQFDLYRARRFESIGEALEAGPENVFKLVLWGQKLGKIPPDIGALKYLQTLDLALNELTRLPDEISGLHYLQGIYANGNRLKEFPQQIILLPVLTRVDLSDNNIHRIPEEIVRMQQLTRLSMDKNAVSAIPPEVYQLRNLSVLEFSGNNITEISGEISNLVKLKKLDLAHNHLQTLPKEITYLSGTLKDLRIQGNRIPREEIEFLRITMPGTNIRF